MDTKKLLAQMSLKEKIGQMEQFNTGYLGETTAGITGPRQRLGLPDEYVPFIGSVLNFNGADEAKRIQDAHLAKDRNKIPLLFMMDVIHGFRTIYPIPLGIGASFDPDLAYACAAMAAEEAAAGGVHVTFSPMVDYVRDARWGRVMESYAEDALVNSRMGAVQVRAYQGKSLRNRRKIAACVKHFACYGGAEAGKDYNTVEVSERAMREFYLPAYKACIDAGVRMLMPSFNSVNGVPSTVNPFLMKQILKKEWKFKGVVISDYNAMGEVEVHGVAADKKEIAARSLDCGLDIEMMSTCYCNHLEELVAEGRISEKAIDRAVLRILQLKKDLGLFEDPMRGTSSANEKKVCLTPAKRRLARRAAAESAVLLKNEDHLLPLKKGAHIALIGPFADSRDLLGGWCCNGKTEDVVTVAEGMSRAWPRGQVTVTAGIDIDAATEAAKNADVAILCIGEPSDFTGEGNSRADLTLPADQQALVRAVAAVNEHTVAVLFGGRPMVLRPADESLRSILAMWFPGTEGGNAVADLLTGRANPCGKVPMSFPKATGQCPLYYNHPSTGRPRPSYAADDARKPYCSSYIDVGNLPLYSFGYGLSYSHFVYESLTLDRTVIDKNGAITVTVRVTNDSDVAGKEVVQLYLHDLVASAVRPIQSLIDFKKVDFAPHETRDVVFTVSEEQLRFVDPDCRLVSEPGEFTLSTGSADHLTLTEKFTLTE